MGRRDVSSVRAALILRCYQQCERVRCGYQQSKGSDVASADNRAKWFRTFIRQIFFRKACARMDSRPRLADDTGECRLELSGDFPALVSKLDAIDADQLLRACRKHLLP